MKCEIEKNPFDFLNLLSNPAMDYFVNYFYRQIFNAIGVYKDFEIAEHKHSHPLSL